MSAAVPKSVKYGYEHRMRRKRYADEVKAGHVFCARCRELILVDDVWDLDHTDDGAAYLGPSHRRCNRSAGGRRGKQVAMANARRQWAREAFEAPESRWSRDW
jgi:hypothetical protein